MFVPVLHFRSESFRTVRCQSTPRYGTRERRRTLWSDSEGSVIWKKEVRDSLGSVRRSPLGLSTVFRTRHRFTRKKLGMSLVKGKEIVGWGQSAGCMEEQKFVQSSQVYRVFGPIPRYVVRRGLGSSTPSVP